MTAEPSEPLPELTIYLGLCGAHERRLGYDDEVEPLAAPRLQSAEAVAKEPSRPIPRDSASQLSTCGNPETVCRLPVPDPDQHEQPPIQAPALSKDPAELSAPRQTPLAPEPPTHPPARLRLSRTAAFDPSADAASRPGGLPCSAFEPETRACASASGSWAGTSSSLLVLFLPCAYPEAGGASGRNSLG